MNDSSLADRVRVLEGRLTLHRRVLTSLAVVVVLAILVAATTTPPALQEVRAKKLVLVDGEGRPRIVMQSEKGDQRQGGGFCGITMHDAGGAERGGWGVFEDGSTVFGLDAPKGVGSPMPDRLALRVDQHGAAELRVLDNKTMIPVRLVSDADGGGGIEFFRYDLEAREATILRTDASGRSERTLSLGGK